VIGKLCNISVFILFRLEIDVHTLCYCCYLYCNQLLSAKKTDVIYQHNAINTLHKEKVAMCAKVLNTLDFAAGSRWHRIISTVVF